MYSDKVMDHFKNPRNVGEIENASGVGTVGNAKCGDIMRIYLDIDENQIIRDAKFKTFGCGSAIASSSVAPASFAPIKQNAIFTQTIIKHRTRNSGDFSITVMIFAGTPITNRNR